MATVELFLDKPDVVPGVCLRCGEATQRVFPIRFFPFFGKSITLHAPLCSLHQNYFRNRSLLFSVGMIASIFPLVITLAVLLAAFEHALHHDKLHTVLGILGLSFLWFLGWAIVLVYLRIGAIRLSRIRSGKVLLLNVAPEYAEAVRVHRKEKTKAQLLASSHFLGNVQHLEELMESAGPLADDARQALEMAGIFARSFNHDYVGTDHLLLGLRRVDLGAAGKVLENCQLPVKLAEMEVQNITAPAAESPSRLPVTPQLRKVMQDAWEEARSRGHPRLGTAHILLGLVRQEDGIGTQILETFGLDLEDVRKQALRVVLDMDVAYFSAREPGPKAASPDAISEMPPRA
jgi:hypothetical protein